MKTKNLSVVFSILCLLSLLLPACAQKTPGTGAQGGQGETFTICIEEDPETLDNVRTTSGAAELVLASTHDGKADLH